MQGNKALVLLSGGQDSTTCLFWAKQHFLEVEAIGFDYGQRHVQELEQAKIIAALADVPFRIMDAKGITGVSSLTQAGDLNASHARDEQLPSSFTAGRNMLFLAIAASYGYDNGIYDLVTGVCQTDYSGYPDCRRVFIDSMQTTLTLAMQKTVGGSDFRIHTPLMYLTKAETWKLAAELNTENYNVVNIVLDLSLTDYNGDTTPNEWGMGKQDNPASNLRAKGYKEAKEKGWI